MRPEKRFGVCWDDEKAGWSLRQVFRLLSIAGLALACTLFLQAQNGSAPISQIESLLRSQQYDQALSALKTALHDRPSDGRLWTLEGICLALQGNDAGALTAFDHALRIAPDYAPALRGEVEILYKKDGVRAIPLLKRILRSNPSDATAHEMLAALETRAGDCRSAVTQFMLSEDAIAGHPASLEAYGYCLFKLGRIDEAIPVFRQLIPLVPGRAYPSYDLAVLLVSTHRDAEAVEALQPLLTGNQTDADVLSLASQAYEADGNTPKAVELQRRAIVADPTDASNYVLFAVLCLRHDSFQVGIDMLNAGLKRIPGNSSLYLSRGVLNVQLGEFDKAEADFKKAEHLDSRHSIGAYAGDLNILQRNNTGVALAQVRKQLNAYPHDPLLHLLLAEVLMMKGPDPQSPDFKEAMRNAEVAARTKPDLVDAHNQLASMYMSLGQYNQAVKESRTSLQYDPSNETALYHLILSLRHSGEKSDDLRPLVKRLAELHQQSLQHETDRKKFRLVEAPAPTPQPGH